MYSMPEEIEETGTSGYGLSREIKDYQRAGEVFEAAGDRYRSLFEDVPISLYEEDFSAVKIYIDDLRSRGIEDVKAYFENNPQEISHCVEMVKITDVNQATLKMYQAQSKKDLLSGLSQVFTEETYHVFQEELVALANGRTHFEGEALTQTLTGEERYVHVTLSIAPGYEDTWARVLLSLTDITARKRAEEELRNSHEYLERLNNSLQEVIFRVKLPERTIAYVNRAVRNVFGYEEFECLGKTTEFLYPSGKDYQDFGNMLEKTMLEQKEALHTELIMRRENGELFPVEVTTTFLKEEGKTTRVISILRDITRRQRAEDELRLSEAKLREAQRIAHLGNWDWDIITNELQWSDEIYRIFGLTPQQFDATYEAFLGAVHAEDRAFVEYSVDKALYEGRPYDINHRVILPDGAIRIVHEKGEVTFDDNGNPVRMIGTVQDITELKRAEDELRALSHSLVQIQEEERRTIARELHDEIGQSLTVLKLLLDRIKRLPRDNIESTFAEAEALINGLMAQIRNLSLELRPGMLDDLGLLPTLLWYFDNYTMKTQIKVNFKHTGLKVRFPSEIRLSAYRIIQEALTNVARYANVLEVDVAVWFDQNTLWIHIKDRGNGFNMATISPGTSGGLFGMHERARSLEGELTIDSSPGTGTTITVRLPLSNGEKE